MQSSQDISPLPLKNRLNRWRASGTAVALNFRKTAFCLEHERISSNHWGGQAMNVHNAFDRDKNSGLNGRSRARTSRKRKGSASQRRTWFTTGGAAPDYNLRETVAERFMNMSEAHDRIRTKLLATGR
jgi:hypothetical protein